MVFILDRVQIRIGVGKNIFMICMSEKIVMKYFKILLGIPKSKDTNKCTIKSFFFFFYSLEENRKIAFISCNTLEKTIHI